MVEPIKVLCRLIFSLLQTSLRRNEVNIPSVELYAEQYVRLSRWRDARVMVRGEIGNAPTINGPVAARGEIGNALDISVKEDK